MADQVGKWLDFYKNEYLKVFGVVEYEFDNTNWKFKIAGQNIKINTEKNNCQKLPNYLETQDKF